MYMRVCRSLYRCVHICIVVDSTLSLVYIFPLEASFLCSFSLSRSHTLGQSHTRAERADAIQSFSHFFFFLLLTSIDLLLLLLLVQFRRNIFIICNSFSVCIYICIYYKSSTRTITQQRTAVILSLARASLALSRCRYSRYAAHTRGENGRRRGGRDAAYIEETLWISSAATAAGSTSCAGVLESASETEDVWKLVIGRSGEVDKRKRIGPGRHDGLWCCRCWRMAWDGSNWKLDRSASFWILDYCLSRDYIASCLRLWELSVN